MAHLCVADTELAEELEPGLLVQQPGPGVPGSGQQLVQGRVRQVGHIGQVQLLDSGWWCRGVNQNSRSFSVSQSRLL